MPITHKFVPLNNGFKVPCIGFNTSKLEAHNIEKLMLCAIDSGYRHIDCVSTNDNVKDIGVALQMKLSLGTLNRTNFYISSKVPIEKDFQSLRRICEKTLADIGVSYLDLYLLHSSSAPEDYTQTEKLLDIIDGNWREMERLVDAGLVRSIGLSNFNRNHLDRIIKICNIKPVMLHLEGVFMTLDEELAGYAQSFGIQVSVHDLSSSTTKEENEFLENKDVCKMARAYHKTPAQLLIRQAVQRDIIVLSHSTDPQRIRANIDVFDFELTSDEVEKLEEVKTTIKKKHRTEILGNSKSLG
uniref:Aldo_ket_red domain-containing protein n=2 Tax=Mesocestoides corti TaxID=53468 RepID=A0A5K3EV77_MESCO